MGIVLVHSFRYVEGCPKIYTSSSHGKWDFCADCGSHIAFRATDSDDTVEIDVGTLDDPAAVTLQYHIWCDSQVSQFATADDLARCPESSHTQNET